MHDLNMACKASTKQSDSTGNLGFEAKLWLAADKLRNNMDAMEFKRNQHPNRRADYVLENPPFNNSDWFWKHGDVRWRFGVPLKGNANFAWVQHFIHHLAPQGLAGFVLANGSMSSNQSSEGEIRRALIKADLVDCIVALPSQLFYSTQIPVCLWFLAKNKAEGTSSGSPKPKRRDRRKQTLFIDARKLAPLIGAGMGNPSLN